MSGTFVVVGGDAAGMSAASKAKREDPDREVVVFERGEWVSYAACGMPYYVKGAVEEEGTKRIDTVATALHAGMTVGELETADLAYAPPFSPVWDPVLTGAKVLAGRVGR